MVENVTRPKELIISPLSPLFLSHFIRMFQLPIFSVLSLSSHNLPLASMAEHHTAAHPCHSRGSFPLLLAEALSDHPTTTTTTITATQHHPNTTTTTRLITIPYNPNTKLTHNQQKFKSKSTKIQTNFNRKSQTHFTSTQKTHVRVMGEIKRDYCCRLDRKSDLPINIKRS